VIVAISVFWELAGIDARIAFDRLQFCKTVFRDNAILLLRDRSLSHVKVCWDAHFVHWFFIRHQPALSHAKVARLDQPKSEGAVSGGQAGQKNGEWVGHGGRFSVFGCRLSVVGCQLSVVSCQLSVVSCQL
jgi:hypothetical protein